MESIREILEGLDCPTEFHISECDGGRKIESDDDWEKACRTLYGEPVTERCDRCSGECGTNRSDTRERGSRDEDREQG